MPGVDVGGLLRSGVASLCLAAGVLHVSAAADHRGMAAHVSFFLAVAVLQSGLGGAVLLGARPARWLTVSTVVNLVVAVVWVVSRTSGLSVDGTSAPEAIGFKDGISTLIEVGAAAGAGLWWLLPDGARRVTLPSGRRTAALLGTGVWAVGAAGLFAGHTHSPGHTHAAQHAHATGAATPDAAAHPHSSDPIHSDHPRSAEGGAPAAGSSDGGHAHDSASAPGGVPHADHHHPPDGRAPLVTTSAASAHEHGSRHHNSQTEPAPSPSAGHHDHVAGSEGHSAEGHSAEGHGHHHDSSAGADHGNSGDDHDNNHEEGGSGNDRGDEDGGASPLEDVLKLIRPR